MLEDPAFLWHLSVLSLEGNQVRPGTVPLGIAFIALLRPPHTTAGACQDGLTVFMRVCEIGDTSRRSLSKRDTGRVLQTEVLSLRPLSRL